MTFAAVVRVGAKDNIVGVGRYTVTRDGGVCVCAVTVLYDWQRTRLDSVLMRHLIYVAEAGI